MKAEDVAGAQKAYYGALYHKYGAGVDAVASSKQIYKDLRYERLSRVFGEDRELTVHEIGCGLGHYYEYLASRFPDRKIAYSGSEVTPEFVAACREKFPQCQFFLRDVTSEPCDERYDYVVLPGVFYHLVSADAAAFFEYCKTLLDRAFLMCRRAIAVNFVTGFCDYFRDDLFYCDVKGLLEFVTCELSRFFVLDHAYPLYEFTLHIFKPEYVRSLHPAGEFEKYHRGTVVGRPEGVARRQNEVAFWRAASRRPYVIRLMASLGRLAMRWRKHEDCESRRRRSDRPGRGV